MITKRNGNGQTECRSCKEKGEFALNWDSFLYNFNNEPYCFDCLMEKLEDLQQRIDEAIRMLEINIEITMQQPSENKSEDEFIIKKYKDLLSILKGEDKE